MIENLERFEYLVKEMKRLAGCAMIQAKQVEDAAFKRPFKEIEVLALISAAQATISTLEAIYISNHDDLEHDDIETFIHRFNTFLDEARTNTITDHSQQWTDIEFDKLQEAYSDCVLYH